MPIAGESRLSWHLDAIGLLGWTRTSDILFRKQVPYPPGRRGGSSCRIATTLPERREEFVLKFFGTTWREAIERAVHAVATL
jgi:hypothetical protein